jgi:hypothetical protein
LADADERGVEKSDLPSEGVVRKKPFQDLVGSIKEAGRIHRGEIAPSREFVVGAADYRYTTYSGRSSE